MSNGNTKSDSIINFYDNYVPSLKDGQYSITLTQSLTPDPANSQVIPAAPQSPVQQQFLVNGPRFSFPPADVNHVFPANNSTGVFDTFLPQIVLNEQALPWERNLNLSPIQSTIPWMALLLFSNNELPAPTPASPPQSPPASESRQNPTRISVNLLNNVVNATYNNGQATTGPPAGILGPSNMVLEVNEDPNNTYCNTIDIPVAIFNALAPNLGDATFLAHTRVVSLANKAVVLGQNGFFSAVIANRFAVPPAPASPPQSPGTAPLQNTNIVHLVSLEGFETWLNVNGQPNVTGYNTVRMISLYSWSFNVQAERLEDFGELMNHLISCESVNGTNLLLRMPPLHPPLCSPPDPKPIPPLSPINPVELAVQTRIQDGYVALSYEMQSGDQSFAWYRGPFSPVPVSRFLQQTAGPPANPLTPGATADAMIFDPGTGIFDQSYAVAFQTGRSLALASQPFATSLVNWRKATNGHVNLLLERMTGIYKGKMQADGFFDAQGRLHTNSVTALAKLLNTNLIEGVFTGFLASDFYLDLSKKIGKEGGNINSGYQNIIQQTARPKPVGPKDLRELMQNPTVVSLLQQLSGLDSLGVLSAPLNQNDSGITLVLGLPELVPAGTTLTICSNDGSTIANVMVSADAALKSTKVSINPYTGTTSLPVNSTVQVNDVNEDAQAVIKWLASTALLNSVPFNNLVANPNMLPRETIRFFYLDQNWIDALLDGAMSIGVQSSRDTQFNQIMRDKLYAKVQTRMAKMRNNLPGMVADDTTPVTTNTAGFLIRSQNIANYPGLQITAKSATENNMKPLRLATLAGDLILAIYPDIPVEVVFTQPSEGLVFGVEDDSNTNNKEIYLRYIPGVTDFTPANIGSVIPAQTPISFEQVQQANRNGNNIAWPAMNIAGTGSTQLVGIIQTALPGNPVLTPASFAVEMVCVPEQMNFEPVSSLI